MIPRSTQRFRKLNRKLHHGMAWWSVAFLLVIAVTGLLWAYAPYLYWAEGYMQLKNPLVGPKISSARLSISDVLNQVGERFGEEMHPQEITLKADAGLLFYQIKFRKREQKLQMALLDALSGVWTSPIKKTDAIKFARQYVVAGLPLVSAELLDDWVLRKRTTKRPAWYVKFGDPGETEIFIDPYTGSILEDQDRIRKFHFFIMNLHQLNFFGFHKTLTIIPGTFLICMVVTGIALWSKSKRKQKPPKDHNGATSTAVTHSTPSTAN